MFIENSQNKPEKKYFFKEKYLVLFKEEPMALFLKELLAFLRFHNT